MNPFIYSDLCVWEVLCLLMPSHKTDVLGSYAVERRLERFRSMRWGLALTLDPWSLVSTRLKP